MILLQGAHGGGDLLRFAPDGRTLVAPYSRGVQVWDLATGGFRRNDATVKLYDTATFQVAETFDWKIGSLRSIIFSPDGMLAAAGSASGKIVVWDVDL